MTTEAHCPYCQNSLEKPPSRKKKCPHCGEYMYVRGGKSYTEKQVEEFDFLRLWLWKLEDSYGVTKADVEERRKDLSSKFGFRASAHDTVWSVLNEQVTTMKPYPSLRHKEVYLDMAMILREEGKDPSPTVQSANKVKSDLNRAKIQQQTKVNQQLDMPGDKWTILTANDEGVCPSCKEKGSTVDDFVEAKAVPASEAIKIPLNCTSDWGCRCWIGPYVALPDLDEPKPPSSKTTKPQKPQKAWWNFWE